MPVRIITKIAKSFCLCLVDKFLIKRTEKRGVVGELVKLILTEGTHDIVNFWWLVVG